MNHSTVQIETGDFRPFNKIKIVVFYKKSTGTCHLWMTNNSLSKRSAAILIKTVFTNSWTIFKVRASFPRRIVLITDKGGGSRENDSKRNQQCTLNWHLHTTNLQNWDQIKSKRKLRVHLHDNNEALDKPNLRNKFILNWIGSAMWCFSTDRNK